MYLCEYVYMRTTIDLPEALFRKTKATAALRGSSMKELIVQAIQKEVSAPMPETRERVKLPLVRLPKGNKIDLTGFDFDDLLG